MSQFFTRYNKTDYYLNENLTYTKNILNDKFLFYMLSFLFINEEEREREGRKIIVILLFLII